MSKKVSKKNSTKKNGAKKKSVGMKQTDYMKRMAVRMKWVKGAMLLCILILVYRIGYFKIVKGEEYEKEVRARMMSAEKEVKALRGTIVDRNNKTVATSTLSYHIILDPINILKLKDEQRVHTYDTLAKYAKKTPADIEALINSNPETYYKIFMKDISAEDMMMLKEANVKGVSFEESFVRNYPKGTLAAQTIGFYNKTEGQYGIEQAYNEVMLGKPGRIYSKLQEESIV
ncbi:MAG: hypothetical protein RSD98_07210, partial [Niameybacter sp.]